MSQNEHDAAEDISSGQQRVTPQELTKALSAIEAHKEEEAKRQEEQERYLAGTISINQAIEELALDSTSDEIWEEVQKQRQYQQRSLPQQQRTHQRESSQYQRQSNKADLILAGAHPAPATASEVAQPILRQKHAHSPWIFTAALERVSHSGSKSR